MNLEEFKRKLSSYRHEDVVITPHAALRAEIRNISKEDIIDNIVNPKRLKTFGLENEREKKYNCWFEYGKNMGQFYVIVLNGKSIVVTVIKIRTRWQKRVENYVKKLQSRL